MEKGSLRKVIDLFHDLNEHEKSEDKKMSSLVSAVGMLKKSEKKHESSESKAEEKVEHM